MEEFFAHFHSWGSPIAIVGLITAVVIFSYNSLKGHIQRGEDHIKDLIIKDQVHNKEMLKKDQDHLKEMFAAELKPINKQLDNHISELKAGQRHINNRIDGLYERPPQKKEGKK